MQQSVTNTEGRHCKLCIEGSVIGVNTIVMHVDILVVLICIHIDHLSLPGRELPGKQKEKKRESFEFTTLYSNSISYKTTYMYMSMSLLITHLAVFWWC